MAHALIKLSFFSRSGRSAWMLAIGLSIAGCSNGGDETGVAADPSVSDRSRLTDSGGNAGSEANTRITETGYFRRLATFPVCLQLAPDCDIDDETVAEIVAASADGMTLIYTDGANDRVGLVDIGDPGQPAAAGMIDVEGEPTSVVVAGAYALVAVNTSADFIAVSGELKVIDLASRQIVASIDLGGQPDSVAVSKDLRFAAVVIENERDEDQGSGEPPQLPAGRIAILDLIGEPANWPIRQVALTGLASLFGGDPEPEYVDINDENQAIVTLQENNHLVLIDLATGRVLNHFPAGTVDLAGIDATEESPARISLTESLADVAREPDAVTWISNDLFATADEGDLFGGSRGYTVFNTSGEVVFGAGNSVEQLAVSLGHYPDARSENKGGEPEGAEFARFDSAPLLFIATERASLLAVYDVSDPGAPLFRQALPTTVGPEGILALPARNLLVAAGEVDARDDKIRSSITVYRYEADAEAPAYPTIRSTAVDGAPIAWGALSGLAADRARPERLYAVNDSFYQRNQIYIIDNGVSPAMITGSIGLTDPDGVLSGLPNTQITDNTLPEDSPARIGVFDSLDLAQLVNSDGSVNLDPEGIAADADGGFWIVSEGAGTVDDSSRPIASLNLLLKTSNDGVIQHAFTLPDEVNAMQSRFGFEGVADNGHQLVVAFQRAWGDEVNPRLAIFDKATCTWRFLYYPLDAVESAFGGWVGLSDITPAGNDEFMVVERDNQGGPDAAIKRIYRFSIAGLADGATVSKVLVKDLMDDLARAGGLIPEKIEGLARLGNGDLMIVNDNDGVNDNSGETQLIRLAAP